MIPCQFCSLKCGTVFEYVRHMRLHRHSANGSFKCGVTNCSMNFKNFNAFKSHSYRYHKRQPASVSVAQLCTSDLMCHIDYCAVHCEDLTGFLSHLKTHLKEGTAVTCPFQQCKKTFSVLSTFTSHLSRCHKGKTEHCLLEAIVQGTSGSQVVCQSEDRCEAAFSSEGTLEQADISPPENVDDGIFLKNLALFYLKLQAKLLLPASVIQTVIEGFQEIHDISQVNMLSSLKEKLLLLGVPEADVKKVLDEVEAEDLFRTCNTEILKTDQRRKTVFKKSFNYIEPHPICLGNSEAGKECFAQYIPIKETLTSLMKSESIREQHRCTHLNVRQKDIYKDVWDGKIIAENALFKSDPLSLGLILFQDAFEVVNPLGSGKKKHKVLAVYLTLGDILPHNRSNIDHMQLVLLCREQDFRFFGQDLVLAQLLKDLKDLEVSGIQLPNGDLRKACVCAIAGDNLGSHGIGAFSENFSTSVHFCRYCEIDRASFVADPLAKGPHRTVQSYKDNVQTDDVQQKKGVKFDSLFNELSYFHVCNPGLPPCIGHDLFEGVVSYDLALYIKHLVRVEKHFTYVELNRRINQFKYLGNDALDKPCEVNSCSDKLGGHAVQNWCLLRLLPVLIGDKIKNPADNDVWQLVLHMRQMVEFICAPAISSGQIAYLKVMTEDYLYLRAKLFPNHSLRPKHHYVSHYPDLTVQFGPLIRLWTLRFESKHTYFKQCAKKLHNFKNLCSTLAERHQLLQAYLSAGSLFPPSVVVEKGTDFVPTDYNEDIKDAVAHLNFESNALISHEAKVKGTKYKKNMFLVLDQSDEGITFGKIKAILIQGDSVYFLTEVYNSVTLIDQGLHSLAMTPAKRLCCVDQESLLDYYPLPLYKLCGLSVLALHHSFPSQE